MGTFMSKEQLKKKLVKDIIGDNCAYARVIKTENIPHEYHCVKQKNIYTCALSVDPFGEVHIVDVKHDFHVVKKVDGGKLIGEYQQNFDNYTMSTVDNGEYHILYHKLPKDMRDVIVLELFRETDIPDFMMPVIYLVTDTSEDTKLDDIVEDYIDGMKSFSYEQIMTNTDIEERRLISFTGNDQQINEGFDIESTAEFFAINDTVKFNEDRDVMCSWNPDTKILTEFSRKSPDSSIWYHVTLYYVEDFNTVDFDKAFLVYEFSDIDPSCCKIVPIEKLYRNDEKFDITYDVDNDGYITYFHYYLVGTDVEITSKRVDECSFIIDNGDISYCINHAPVIYNPKLDMSTIEIGTYYGIDTKLTWIHRMPIIRDLVSFIYTEDNLWIRSIAWNLIKVI